MHAYLKQLDKGADGSPNIPSGPPSRVLKHATRSTVRNIGKSTGPLEWWAPPLLFYFLNPRHTARDPKTRAREKRPPDEQARAVSTTYAWERVLAAS